MSQHYDFWQPVDGDGRRPPFSDVVHRLRERLFIVVACQALRGAKLDMSGLQKLTWPEQLTAVSEQYA